MRPGRGKPILIGTLRLREDEFYQHVFTCSETITILRRNVLFVSWAGLASHVPACENDLTESSLFPLIASIGDTPKTKQRAQTMC